MIADPFRKLLRSVERITLASTVRATGGDGRLLTHPRLIWLVLRLDSAIPSSHYL